MSSTLISEANQKNRKVKKTKVREMSWQNKKVFSLKWRKLLQRIQNLENSSKMWLKLMKKITKVNKTSQRRKNKIKWHLKKKLKRWFLAIWETRQHLRIKSSTPLSDCLFSWTGSLLESAIFYLSSTLSSKTISNMWSVVRKNWELALSMRSLRLKWTFMKTVLFIWGDSVQTSRTQSSIYKELSRVQTIASKTK